MFIQFYRTLNPLKLRKEWRWRAIHNNGNIMANGAESYVRKIDCEKAVQTIARDFPNAPQTFI